MSFLRTNKQSYTQYYIASVFPNIFSYKGPFIIYVGRGGEGGWGVGEEIFFVLAWKKKRDPPL